MSRSLGVRRTLVALALAPLLLGGVAGCGSDSTATDSTDSSAGSTAAALSGLSKGDRVSTDEFIHTVAQGAEASTTAHITMKIDTGAARPMDAEGDVDYTGDAPQVAMTMSLPTGDTPTKADIRFVGGMFYLSMGEMTNGKFLKLDPADKNGPMSGMGDLTAMLDQMDPRAMLEKIKPSVKQVTFEGADSHGDHYRLTMDPAEMARSMNLPPEATARMPKTLSYDLWLDHQHRMSRMTMDLPVSGTTTSMEMNISGWGDPVTIEAPPASQVTEMSGMAGMPASPQA